MLHKHSKIKGSLLVTAVFLMVVFSGLTAILAKILMNQDEVEISSVLGVQADALAKSGVEFALGSLFLPNTPNGTQSPIFAGKNITDGLEVTLIECSNGSTNDFCNVQYNSCKIDKVSVTVNDLSLISSNTDVKYQYHIISQASCDATFFSEDNIHGYKISRQVDVYATDVRWRDSNK